MAAGTYASGCGCRYYVSGYCCRYRVSGCYASGIAMLAVVMLAGIAVGVMLAGIAMLAVLLC
jgi:hypothetical protein